MLCLLTSFVLLGWMAVTALVPPISAEGDLSRTRLLPMTISLVALGMAFTFLPNAYQSHEHSPDTTGFPFHSWQEQARTTALLAALPLGAFVLALVPLNPFALISALVGAVAATVNLLTFVWMGSWPVDAPPGLPASPDP